MGKLIGYACVSTRRLDVARQVDDLLAAAIRRDDIYVHGGVRGTGLESETQQGSATLFEEGDTLIITTLDRLVWPTQNMLAFAEMLRNSGWGRGC